MGVLQNFKNWAKINQLMHHLIKRVPTFIFSKDIVIELHSSGVQLRHRCWNISNEQYNIKNIVYSSFMGL